MLMTFHPIFDFKSYIIDFPPYFIDFLPYFIYLPPYVIDFQSYVFDFGLHILTSHPFFYFSSPYHLVSNPFLGTSGHLRTIQWMKNYSQSGSNKFLWSLVHEIQNFGILGTFWAFFASQKFRMFKTRLENWVLQSKWRVLWVSTITGSWNIEFGVVWPYLGHFDRFLQFLGTSSQQRSIPCMKK
jgi:hypothetical protein